MDLKQKLLEIDSPNRPGAEGGRCDILWELISIGFSRPKISIHFKNHG